MSNIIEKLGITPIDKIYFEFTDYGICGDYCEASDVEEVEQHRNNMLEALIESIISYEFETNGKYYNPEIEKQRKIVEQATGKSWEEIKNFKED